MPLCNAWVHTQCIYTHSHMHIYICAWQQIYIYRIHVPISTYYEHFHSIYGYVIIVCVYKFICSCVSYYFITRQWNNTVCPNVLWHVDTDLRFPSLETVSSPFHVFFTWGYCCKMGPATIAFSRTLQIFFYLYIYMCIFLYICI